jgi:hypothetical protein
MDYQLLINKIRSLQLRHKLFFQYGTLSTVSFEELNSKLVKTIIDHARIAKDLTGVPVVCSLESCKSNKHSYLIIRNLKTGTLLERKVWYLPEHLMDENYEFYILWLDSLERGYWYPDEAVPVITVKEVLD